MSRSEFIKTLDNTYKNYRLKHAFCYENVGITVAVTFQELSKLETNLGIYLTEKLSPGSKFVGLCLNSKKWITALLISLWKNEYAAVIVNVNNLDTVFNSFKYLVSDSYETVSCGFLVDSFNINDSVFYIYDVKPAKVTQMTQDWDICYVLTTSGTTGKPKVVQVPWACIYPNALELIEEFNVNEGHVVSSMSPISFDPFFIEIFFSLITGATLYISEDREVKKCKNEPTFICGAVEVSPKPITVLQMTPSMLKILQQTKPSSYFSKLKVLIIGGESFALSINIPPFTQVYNIYGITEISCWSFLHHVTSNDEKVSIGKPLNNILFKIDEGELLLGSDERKCIIDQENPSDLKEIIWRKTGDLVEVENGQLFITSRTDNQAKKFGTKISTEKIKRLFQEHHIDVIVVFNDDIKCLGVFIPDDEIMFDLEIVDIMKDPKIQKIINQFADIEKPDVIFKIKEIPLTYHGKTDYLTLRNLMKNHLTMLIESDLSKTFEAFWCQTLNNERVFCDKSFIESGGNSILAVKLISRLDISGILIPNNLVSVLLGKYSFEKCLEMLLSVNEKKSQAIENTRTLQGEKVKLHLKWSYNMKKCVDATPSIVVLNRVSYVVICSHSAEISLLKCSDGLPLWTTSLSDRIESGIAVSSSQKRLYTGCYDNFIYCLASETGAIIWKYKTRNMVKSTPKLSYCENFLYCGSYDKHIYCLNAEDGTFVASYELEGSILASPIIMDSNLIFIAALNGRCVALKNENLALQWKKDLSSPIFSTPCFIQRLHLVIVAEVDGTIHGFNTVNGDKKWIFQCGGNIFSGLTYIIKEDEDFITFGCHDRHLYLLRIDEEPSIVWKVRVESAIPATPHFADDLIACVASIGVLYLVDLEGNIISRLQFGCEAFSAPIQHCDSIYVGCRNDCLLCIERINNL